MMNFKNLIKIGEKPGGTVPGGMFKDSAENIWMLKFPQHEIQARNEVLASKLYEAAGVNVPQLELVENGDSRYVASRWNMDLYRPKKLDRKLNGLMEGFVIDAWLANWDVIGLEYDNVMADDNDAVRVDLGGSLLFRAQGEPKGKAFGPVVMEAISLLDSRVNVQSANVFGRHLMEKDFMIGTMKLEGVQDAQIKALVEKYGLPAIVSNVLIQRKQFLLSSNDVWEESKAIN